MNMVKGNGLIDRFPGEDGKDGEEDFLCRHLKAMVGNRGKNQNQESTQKDAKLFSHVFSLFRRV
jgi:hypothetical protein